MIAALKDKSVLLSLTFAILSVVVWIGSAFVKIKWGVDISDTMSHILGKTFNMPFQILLAAAAIAFGLLAVSDHIIAVLKSLFGLFGLFGRGGK